MKRMRVFVGNFNMITSGGPDIAVTGVGFEPDAVFFHACANDDQAATPDFIDTTREAAFNWGYADIGGTEVSMFYGAEDAVGTMNTFATKPITTRCYLSYTAKGGGGWALAGDAEWKSMDADGFTVTVRDFPAAAHYVKFACIKGGNWHSAVVGLNTSTGTQKFSNLAAFIPSGAMFAIPTAGIDGKSIALGWASNDGGSKPWPEGALLVTDDDGVGTSDTKGITMSDKALARDAAGSTTIEGEADLESWDANGVTIDITLTAGGGPPLAVIQFGEGTAPPAFEFEGTQGDNIAVF